MAFHSHSVSHKVIFWALVIAVAAVAITPSAVLATKITVGGDKGWTKGFDYQGWAQSTKFHAGDKLFFKYPKGVHNVYKVNQKQFQNCDIASATKKYTSGGDTITLKSGTSWFICGVGDHCRNGQKLVVNVN
ncbi:unnamed protein product [Linum tenue]|uniref:Phytocyanin domain-containing protein n=2 Tax=Linum tenue TaxID=586396 RepID=A0AAV0HHB8_9ROSI|nr:unnamed protein product [Linum tenue]